MLEATSRSPKEAQDQRAEVGQDIARQLQQARLARGEDLADIARQLHIRPAYLAALEQGQFELSVGRPYLLGFLRSYGTYLGLDGDKLVGALKQWLDQDAASPGPNERKPFVASRRGTAVMVTAALLLVAAVYATGPSILDHIDRGSGAGSAATPGEGMLVTGNTVLQPEDAEQAHSGDATAAPARVSGTLSAARAKASHPSGTKPQADSSIGSASSTGSGKAVAARPAAEPARAPQAPEGAAAAALAGKRATPATPPGFAPGLTPLQHRPCLASFCRPPGRAGRSWPTPCQASRIASRRTRLRRPRPTAGRPSPRPKRSPIEPCRPHARVTVRAPPHLPDRRWHHPPDGSRFTSPRCAIRLSWQASGGVLPSTIRALPASSRDRPCWSPFRARAPSIASPVGRLRRRPRRRRYVNVSALSTSIAGSLRPDRLWSFLVAVLAPGRRDRHPHRHPRM
jgi:transcriptional regulator with XRE-family HTH domain